MKTLVRLFLCIALAVSPFLVLVVLWILKPTPIVDAGGAGERVNLSGLEAAIARDPDTNWGGVMTNYPDMVTEAPMLRFTPSSIGERFLTITNREVVSFNGSQCLILRMSDEEWRLITEHYATNISKMTLRFYGDAIDSTSTHAK